MIRKIVKEGMMYVHPFSDHVLTSYLDEKDDAVQELILKHGGTIESSVKTDHGRVLRVVVRDVKALAEDLRCLG